MDTGIFPLAKTDLGPAAKTLVEKIATATGTLYRKRQTNAGLTFTGSVSLSEPFLD
jgi:hypothetical protein